MIQIVCFINWSKSFEPWSRSGCSFKTGSALSTAQSQPQSEFKSQCEQFKASKKNLVATAESSFTAVSFVTWKENLTSEKKVPLAQRQGACTRLGLTQGWGTCTGRGGRFHASPSFLSRLFRKGAGNAFFEEIRLLAFMAEEVILNRSVWTLVC